MGLWIFLKTLHNLLGEPVPVLDHCHSKGPFFFMFDISFYSVLTASHLFTREHQGDSGCALTTWTYEVLMHIWCLSTLSLSFCRLIESSALSLCSYFRWHLTHLFGPALTLLLHNAPLLYWGAQNCNGASKPPDLYFAMLYSIDNQHLSMHCSALLVWYFF